MSTLSVSELIQSMRNLHITFPRDGELRVALDLACEQMWIRKDPELGYEGRNRHEQDALVISGATGAGKSHSIRKALANLGSILADPLGRPARIVSVTTPSPFSGKELARRILRVLEVDINDKLTEVELWEVVVANCAGHRVALLHIDEFQRFTTAKAVGRSESGKSIERLSATLNELLMAEDWPITLLISGTEDVLPFWRMRLVDQVHRRTKFVLFEPMNGRYHPALRQALSKYCQLACIVEDGLEEDLAGRIAMAAENTVGIALELMQEAVVSAVREKSTSLSISHFARVYAARTGLGRDFNPFLAKDWSKIGVREKAELEDRYEQKKGRAR
ncbi:ATP-binding protein [Devosia sp. PTR5]|uniref:ATP-binding protein n=1 Tax=Devosia oryzisoli TaxID=2774138 RepID=A0A927FY84_9HYPH|nr:ATP-binding protein [Devosia oryzisoli]MBD8066988.1 ATP-binding protein [Devosia oryzisoli]